jgi:hypothetical protein
MTPTQPWDQGAFINAVVSSRISIHEFHDYFGTVANGVTGNCFTHWNFYSTWEHMPAFTDVPPEWQTRYTEYRAILHELRIAFTPISDVCASGGGFIPPATDQLILSAVAGLRARAEQLEAAVLAG